MSLMPAAAWAQDKAADKQVQQSASVAPYADLRDMRGGMEAARQRKAGALDCEKAQSQLAMNLCADRDYRAADAAMNAQWKRTLAAVRGFDKDPDYPPGRKSYSQLLIEAQRAWLAYRDAHCVSESHRPAAGSMEPMLFSLCMLGLTEERRQQLAQIARGGQGE